MNFDSDDERRGRQIIPRRRHLRVPAVLAAIETATPSVVHVGAPSPGFQFHWVTTKVIYHRFTDLREENGGTMSGQICLLGHQWELKISPQGTEMMASDQSTTSIFLKHLSQSTIEIEFGVAIKDVNDNQVAGGVSSTMKNRFFAQSEAGYQKFMSYQKALNHLVEGSLVVELRMKQAGAHISPFIPENPSGCQTIQSLFMDESSADVVFDVGNGKQPTAPERKKVMKTSSPMKFYAHKAILKNAAPQLAELCTSSAYPALIHIADVEPEIFNQMLLYIYGFDIPSIGDDFSDAEKIIEAADRYGVTNLKLDAEARYVDSVSITMANVMENLLFADSKNCSLLKEVVMDFVVKNKAEILEKRTLVNAPEGLTNDILSAMMRGEKGTSNDKTAEFSSMCISELRRRAHAKGLDVDGSREMLISALEDASGVE